MKSLLLRRFLMVMLLLFVTTPAVAGIDIDSNYELSFNGELGYLKPQKSPYLGTQIGAGPNIFNFVEAGDDLRLNAKGVSLKSKSFYGFKIFTHVQNGIANDSQDFPTLDPQGSNLLIPGVGVGPAGAGFSLAGPNNQIIGARYDTEYDFYNVMLGIEKEFQTAIPALNISPSFGVGYSRSTTKNRFEGDIPFFVRHFDYESKTRITTISPTLGINALYTINTRFQFFSGADYAYDLNRGKGVDSLSFTGFADQVANITSDENTHYYGLKSGVTYKPFNFLAITLQGNYKSFGNVPVIKNRNGLNKSNFSYEDADMLSGSVRMTFKF